MTDIAADIARLLRQNDLLNAPESEETVAHLIRYHIRRYTDARGAVDMSGYAVRHVDGDIHNHELSNLRLIKVG